MCYASLSNRKIDKFTLRLTPLAYGFSLFMIFSSNGEEVPARLLFKIFGRTRDVLTLNSII